MVCNGALHGEALVGSCREAYRGLAGEAYFREMQTMGQARMSEEKICETLRRSLPYEWVGLRSWEDYYKDCLAMASSANQLIFLRWSCKSMIIIPTIRVHARYADGHG